MGCGYWLGFASYFMHHPNPLPWARLHTKVVRFYLDSDVAPNLLNQLTAIFVGNYQGWWGSQAVSTAREWSPVLPLGFICWAIFGVRGKRSNTPALLHYLILFSGIVIGINFIVPFWNRYLVLLLPALAIFVTWFFRTKPKIMWLIIVVGLGFWFRALVPSMESTKNEFSQLLAIQAFRDA